MSSSTIQSQSTVARRSLDHALVLALAVLMAEASIMYTCYSSGRTEGIRVSDGMLTDLEYTLDGLHTLISFGLVVGVVGFWVRRGWALILSSLALLSVLVTYGYWHWMTLKYLSDLKSNYQVYSRVQAEVGFFHGATKWDFVVLVFVIMLLTWILVRLTRMTLERRRGSAT